MKLTTFLILAGLAAQAQPVTEKRPTTDAEKIADALRAGPAFITKDATILDWPSTPMFRTNRITRLRDRIFM